MAAPAMRKECAQEESFECFVFHDPEKVLLDEIEVGLRPGRSALAVLARDEGRDTRVLKDWRKSDIASIRMVDGGDDFDLIIVQINGVDGAHEFQTEQSQVFMRAWYRLNSDAEFSPDAVWTHALSPTARNAGAAASSAVAGMANAKVMV